MFRMTTRCSLHNKPISYLYTPTTPKTYPQLLCEICREETLKKDKACSVKLIDDYVNEVRGNSNKENEKYLRDRNRKNQNSLTSTKDQTLEELHRKKETHELVKSMSKNQAKVLQVIMKMLSEDKKTCHADIQKSISDHRKVWEEYFNLDKEIMFLNKLVNKKLLYIFLFTQGKLGWSRLRTVLKSLNHRKYLCNKLINESTEIRQSLNSIGSPSQKTVLNKIRDLLERPKKKQQREERSIRREKEQKVKGSPVEFKTNKRSKSFR